VSTHRYDVLKPAVASLVRKQQQLCTKLANEVKKELDAAEAAGDGDAEYDALVKLLRVKLGMPRHKQLMRLMEDPSLQRRLERVELDSHSQQNRGMLSELKESLYFSIDEKVEDTELSEMGRNSLRPDDPDSFVLPDLAAGFAEVDVATGLSDQEKLAQREEMQNTFDERSETIHNISQLLRAFCLYERDVRYVVTDNKVVIVDEFTGRPMPGRRFAEGLHQALEAKEDVEIERETQTLATVTIQNYFRMYEKLAGMTGTAETEASEFRDIYALRVVVVPTNRPCIRMDEDDRIFKTTQEKFRAIIDEVRERHEYGQPVLLGTVSVQVSEVLSRMLRREGIIHNVLNAKHHEREAEIVAEAGQRGAVTIATNMAGRGTDIRLGEGVGEIGGLCVIGSERHDSRRIDRQLRGRCSRQGDPGVSRFYVALDDDLMRKFGSERIAGWMEKMGLQSGEELSHPWLNRSIEGAQKKVEQQHYSQRKRTLQMDDVVNKQRNVIYERRRDILQSEDTRQLLFDYIDNAVYEHVSELGEEYRETGRHVDSDALLSWLNHTFPVGFAIDDVTHNDEEFDLEAAVSKLVSRVEEAYAGKETFEEPDRLHYLERMIMLNAHDRLWQEHLYAMDNLRTEVYLMVHAQRDPVVEYKQEAFRRFAGLIDQINDEICSSVFRSATSVSAWEKLVRSMPMHEIHALQEEMDAASGGGGGDDDEPGGPPPGVTYTREQPKVGRNDPCPCGSGRKFKKCCG
jgi:preprotein translocase subunit SecA